MLESALQPAVPARPDWRYFALGRTRRWYSANAMKVGGHWPTNNAQ
jgi:hypothetical protein